VPSTWDEPFGRAALEAMANGAALIASRRGALPEVCGEAALYLDPTDVSAFVAALRRLAGDEGYRRRLQALGRARARAFEIGAATARLDAVRARLLGLD
jgi:alpha-1,3-rhamnosyl/mannosyltransferase